MEELLQISEPQPGVLQIMLNRPNKRNALSIELVTQLVQQLEQAKARVIILGGNGLIFCSGLDLSEAVNNALIQQSANALALVFRSIYSVRAITIAMVQGAALAGGAGILAACDLVVAANDAQIGFPETRRGLVAAMVMTILRRRLAGCYLNELLLLGESISAQRAYEIGLVHRVVEPKALQSAAFTLAEQVLRGSPQATARTKWLIQDLEPRAIVEELDMALLAHSETRHGPEALEGIQAFLEKRTPVWPSI